MIRKAFLTLSVAAALFIPCTSFAQSAAVTGNAAVAGQLNVTNTTNSTSPTTGAIIDSGGLGVSGNLNIGGNFSAPAPNESPNTVYAGPSSGSPAAPSFRPLAQADLPNVTPSGGNTASPLASILGRIMSVTDFGAKCDGTTDDSAAINSALISGPAALPPGQICTIAETITLPSNNPLYIPANSTLKWIGASGGVMLETSPTTITTGAGVIGLGTGATIDPRGAAGTVIRLDSGTLDDIENLTILSMPSNGVVLDLHADIGSPPSGNLYFTKISNINVTGSVGTCMLLTGSGGGSPTDVITDNDFYSIHCDNVQSRGINLVQDTDTNRWYGTYLQINGSGSVCVDFSSASPSANEGVYENAFYGLACDTFNSGLNRTGVVFHYSPWNTIDDFVQSPVAENGAFTNGVAGMGNTIRYINNTAGYVRTYYGSASTTTAPISSIGTCSGLGTGSCSFITGSNQTDGVITLSPTGTPGSSGIVELSGLVPATGRSCVATPQQGTGGWNSLATVSISGVDTTDTDILWNNNSTALTAGSTYYIAYHCFMLSGGWQ